MPCSEKKRQANIANSKKSTGPKSKDGKAKVALNPVTHGLYAVHLVLPGEDPAALDGLMATWIDDWRPPTDARRALVEQAVAHAWRLNRCLRAERARLIEQAREAVLADAREADARVAGAVGRLWSSPASALRTLLADRPGTEAVLAMWRALAEDLVAGDWSDSSLRHGRLLNLLGRSASDDRDGDGPVAASRRLARLNDPDYDPDYDDEDDDDDEGREEEVPADPEALTAELAAFFAGQTAEVEAHLGRLEPSEARAARLAAAACVLDDSPQARAILRAEGHHGRAFRATLNQLIKLTRTEADLVAEAEETADRSHNLEAPISKIEGTVGGTGGSPTGAGQGPRALVGEPPVPPGEAMAPSQATEAEAAAPSKATRVRSEPPAAPSKATEPAPPARDGTGDAIASYLARVGSPGPKQ